MNIPSKREAMYEALQVTNDSTLWVAVKDEAEVLNKVSLNGYTIYTSGVSGKHLFMLDGTFNDLQHLSSDTPTVDATKIGLFETVFRAGYIIFPYETIIGLNGEPVVLRKGKKN